MIRPESPTTVATGSPAGHDCRPGRRAFTLVELLVVVVIVMMLAMLAVGGMAVARQRVRIDRTRTTIRKIHEIVMPQYESYLRRRAPAATLGTGTSSVTMAQNRLRWVRHLITLEMPDTWADVTASPAVVATLPAWFRTGPVLAYAAAKTAGPSAVNGGAECLYLIASRGAGDPDAMEQFRSDEIGDTDKDGMPEFLDAWGRPIAFIRWAPGFTSPVQKADATNYHDPFDPLRVDVAAYALMPLIVSSGPNGSLGLAEAPAAGWSSLVTPDPPGLIPIVGRVTPQPGTTNTASDAADNITNHDFLSK